MTTPLLLAFAAVLLVGGGHLRRWSLLRRHPRLGIATWQVTSVTALLSVAFAGLALVLPTSRLGVGVADLLQACIYTLQAVYEAPTALPRETAGILLALVATLLPAARVAYELVLAQRTARRTADALALVARIDHRLGALVVDADTAAAYCVPGRSQHIVLTTGAIAALDEQELQAVVAHERAHLRERHSLVVAAAQGLAKAVPLPLLRTAASEMTRLVELAADDAAAAATDDAAVAGALVRLSGMHAPRAALAAAGSDGLARVTRLLDRPQPAHPMHRVALVSALALLALTPALLVSYPALAAAGAGVCTLPPL